MSDAGGDSFRCGNAARWLPRVLAGALLVSAMLVTMRIDPLSGIAGSRAFRVGLVVAAAAVALYVVRRGGELRLEIAVSTEGLEFSAGRFHSSLAFDQIESLQYETPFSASRNWIPAAVLIDRQERAWRMPALIDDGDRLIVLLLRHSGREDLASWSDALGVRRRMAGAVRRVTIGYAVAAALLLAGVFYRLH